VKQLDLKKISNY